MEFGFTLNGVPSEGVVCWERSRIAGLDVQSKERLRLAVDTFGHRSCRSQGLPAVITDLYRLQTSDHKLYLAISQKAGRLTVFGGIKTGRKKLFIRVETGAFCEIEPICVLDFYVNEDYQRQGLGKQLFEHFLAAERQTAASVGYDRPSPKLLAFLRKHYGLAHYLPQSNNFVVFTAYFQSARQQSPAGATWTSVSQRPLTAKRRPHMRTADYDQAGLSSRHGWATDRIPAGRNPPFGQLGACSVPAFRTAANRGQQPSQVLDCRHNRSGERSGQCDAAAASSSSQVMMPWDSGADQCSGSTARQQDRDCNPAQPTPRGAAQVYGQTPLTAGKEPAAPRRALPDAYMGQAAGLGCDGSRGVTRRYSMPEQTSASSIMCVKPPWAVDDPYQAGSRGQSMQQKQNTESGAVASMPPPAWSSQVAAGKQRSGAGARDCLIW